MSLDWNISHVADWKALQDDETQRVITECIVFRTMVTHIGRITAENADVFFDRMNLYKGLTESRGDYHTCVENEDGGTHLVYHHITREDIRRRIGLTTNVATLSNKRFASQVAGWLDQQEKERAYYRRQEAKRTEMIGTPASEDEDGGTPAPKKTRTRKTRTA